MYSPTRFRGDADEFWCLAMPPDATPRESSLLRMIEPWQIQGRSAVAIADVVEWQTDDNVGWRESYPESVISEGEDTRELVLADDEDRVLICR